MIMEDLLFVTVQPVKFLPIQNKFYPTNWWVGGYLHKAMTTYILILCITQLLVLAWLHC